MALEGQSTRVGPYSNACGVGVWYKSREAGVSVPPGRSAAIGPEVCGVLDHSEEEKGPELEDAKRALLDRLRDEIGDERVIEAMRRVPREAFVPESSLSLAYEDMPLSIGHGQTISQPYIVAVMVSALELRRTDKVLEIGTGSGYQATVLAELAGEVVGVERLPPLAEAATRHIKSLGYANIKVFVAGTALGWPAEAPYDAIVVAAAAPKLPRGLIAQLRVRGRLVVPVGSLDSQELMKVYRTEEGFSVRTLG